MPPRLLLWPESRRCESCTERLARAIARCWRAAGPSASACPTCAWSRNAGAGVDFQHLDLDDVAGLDDLVRVPRSGRRVAETCTRPSWWMPMSTKAPKAVDVGDDAFEHHAGSGPSLDTFANVAVRNSRARVAARVFQLGEDVLTVGRPKRPSANLAAFTAFTAASPITSAALLPMSAGCARPPGRPPGAPPRASSGLSPLRDAQEAGGPARRSCRRGAAPSAAPGGRRRGAGVAVGRRCCGQTPLEAGPEMREQGDRGGIHVHADGVHAVLDHRVQGRRQARLVDTSCWYWPTPMAFGSIFTSSASGSCRRRAIDTAPRRLTSSSGNSWRRIRRPNTPRRRPADHDLGQLHSPGSASSGRPPACRSRARRCRCRWRPARPGAWRTVPPGGEPSQSRRGSCG